MKAFLSVLLGLMLLTSLVGISYATPIVQPAQGSCDPSKPNYSPGNCGAHSGGNDDPPHHSCFTGRIGPDVFCCVTGITPHSFEVSDIQADVPACTG